MARRSNVNSNIRQISSSRARPCARTIRYRGPRRAAAVAEAGSCLHGYTSAVAGRAGRYRQAGERHVSVGMDVVGSYCLRSGNTRRD
jgi:hypothetical protein